MYIESLRQPEQPVQKMQLQRVAKHETAPGAGRKFPAETRVCGCGIGDGATTQCEQRWMASQLLSVQENERRRIAADLHDGLGQSLSMLKLAVADAEQLFAKGATREATESLSNLRHKVHEALEEVRQIAMNLRPPMLDDLGILPTLSWFFRELESVDSGVKVEKDFNLQESSIPSRLKVTIFRIIQEATSNILKYAKADLIRVQLRHSGDALHFSIADNGEGFDPREVALRSGADRGLGLMSMRERAQLTGGDCTIHSSAGEGTQISICWRFD